MNELTIINHKGQLVLDSREIADMVGKDHSNLLRDIRGYTEILSNPDSNLRAADFFIESEYWDKQNQLRPCYLLTKKGCDMVANKMTGEKGVLFTAAYVTKFEEMEGQIQTPLQHLSPQLQLLISMELEQKRLKQQLNAVNYNALSAKAEAEKAKEGVQAIRDIIVINPRAEWRTQTNKVLNSIGYKTKDYQKVKDDTYKALEERGKCDLKRRLENLQGRALRQGMAPSKADELNYLDVIENDARLKEIYISIVKEIAIKNGVWLREGQA